MNMLILLIPFAGPIAAGAGWGGFTAVRDRRRMAAAFRHGRTDHVVHLPPRPVEAWPVFVAMAGEAA